MPWRFLRFFENPAGDGEAEEGSGIPRIAPSWVNKAAWIAAFFLVGTAVLHLVFLERTADIPVFDIIDVDGEANMPPGSPHFFCWRPGWWLSRSASMTL